MRKIEKLGRYEVLKLKKGNEVNTPTYVVLKAPPYDKRDIHQEALLKLHESSQEKIHLLTFIGNAEISKERGIYESRFYYSPENIIIRVDRTDNRIKLAVFGNFEKSISLLEEILQ